jgi:hypothetical protein
MGVAAKGSTRLEGMQSTDPVITDTSRQVKEQIIKLLSVLTSIANLRIPEAPLTFANSLEDAQNSLRSLLSSQSQIIPEKGEVIQGRRWWAESGKVPNRAASCLLPMGSQLESIPHTQGILPTREAPSPSLGT